MGDYFRTTPGGDADASRGHVEGCAPGRPKKGVPPLSAQAALLDGSGSVADGAQLLRHDHVSSRALERRPLGGIERGRVDRVKRACTPGVRSSAVRTVGCSEGGNTAGDLLRFGGLTVCLRGGRRNARFAREAKGALRARW